MLISTLKEIGFDEKQAKIYLACLELGEASIKEIAGKAQIKRTTIYDVIDEMTDAGYIKMTKRGKKKRFVAASPSELNAIIKKREVLLTQILPELTAISNVEKGKPKVWFYQGIEGLKKCYEDTLYHPKTIIHQWASKHMLDVIGRDWSVRYMKARARKRIFAQCIAADSKEVREFKKQDREHFREIRIVDAKEFPFEIELDIYDNKIAMISGKDKIGVIIESAPIANTMKKIFRMCWENIRK